MVAKYLINYFENNESYFFSCSVMFEMLFNNGSEIIVKISQQQLSRTLFVVVHHLNLSTKFINQIFYNTKISILRFLKMTILRATMFCLVFSPSLKNI
jgi:hypothetical protein